MKKKKVIADKILKNKNLFDHLVAIRGNKDLNYYDNLNETEQKNFNHWMLLHGLSMDKDLIDIVAFLWKDGYYDKIPSKQFYRLLCQIIPRTYDHLTWIKKPKNKNEELIKIISKYYFISKREATQYVDLFFSNDTGLKELCKILENVGIDDKTAENLITTNNDEK